LTPVLRKYLASDLKSRQVNNAGYSLRAYASDQGVSPASLSQYFSGKEIFLLKPSPSLLTNLGLTTRPSIRF
jgi:hypothetical protein